MDIEDLLGRTPLEAFAILEVGREDVHLAKTGASQIVECREDGFFLSTGAGGGVLQHYSVYLKATDDFLPLAPGLCRRFDGVTTMADLTAAYGAPVRDVPSIRLPGLPPTPAGKMFRGEGLRVSGLSEDGVRLVQVSLFLDARG